MAQQPPFPPGAYIVQGKKETEGQVKSRGGVASANPPSVSLPASLRLESDIPVAQVPVTGEVPFMNPATTPIETLAARTVNNAPNNVSIAIDKTNRNTPATTAGINGLERSINEADGSKPQALNVIARDGRQVITNDTPNDPDHA